ncbi:MAG: alpha-keto acid decarboxylase family protein [Armatimonadetes bacterium]|nr:alpha-keto acid decarboxylase family protein [Armatimonadota bacterium]
MANEAGGTQTVGGYVLDRLYALGLRHIFGIPGDYVLGLYRLIEDSPIQHVGTTREDCAGFAADAYARLNGIGAACLTYCVGGLNAVNAIACAYAERSPVVLLSGSPGLAERRRTPLLHHMVRDFSTQQEVYEKITVAATVINDPLTAPREVDRALAALQRYKRPVYLEIPRDLVFAPLGNPLRPPADPPDASDADALAEAVAEVSAMLASARRPVVLAGAEVHRFGLQETLLRLVERLQMPVASTLLGKSVIREDHPLFVGVYGGLIGRDAVNRFVDESDCCLMLGSILTDIDLDASSPGISEARTVHATADRIAVKHHQYGQIRFEDFLHALADAPLPAAPIRPLPGREEGPAEPPAADSPATLAGVFRQLEQILDENMVVIADVGESLFAAADLRVHRAAEFLSPAYYTTMGFAVPAALGAGVAAPTLRPLVLVGDGAFQMTGTELSTCVRYGQSPIVVILNNRGYSTEREMLDGPFNDIAEWRYERVCDLVGGGVGHVADTHGAVADALEAALDDPRHMHVLNVRLDPADRSPAMRRLAGRLARRLSLGRPE